MSRSAPESYPGWKFNWKKSLIQVEDHVAAFCRHVAHHAHPLGGPVNDSYHQWYFFDDLWASAHPDVANALLVHGRRWDVLSAPRSRPLE